MTSLLINGLSCHLATARSEVAVPVVLTNVNLHVRPQCAGIIVISPPLNIVTVSTYRSFRSDFYWALFPLDNICMRSSDESLT